MILNIASECQGIALQMLVLEVMVLFDLDVLKSGSTITNRICLGYIIRSNGIIQFLLCVFYCAKEQK